MKKGEFTVVVDRAIDKVFEFAVNPKNTPFWVDSIVKEQTSQWPIKLGTKYRNQNQEGEWTSYTVSEFEQDRLFTLSEDAGNYRVRYTFKPHDDNKCEMTYYEWVEGGEPDAPFSQAVLDKFKRVAEEKIDA